MVDLYNEEVRKLYLVCERQKWCYIAIQKVAGTSVRLAFLEHVRAPHKEGDNLRAELGKDLGGLRDISDIAGMVFYELVELKNFKIAWI